MSAQSFIPEHPLRCLYHTVCCAFSHAEVTENSLLVAGMTAVWAPLCVYCCIVLQPPMAYINQPKTFIASIACRMIISMGTPLSQMARCLEGSVERCAGW